MQHKPRIAVLIGAAWPRNDASGPVQSVRQIAARFAGDADFELFARSGPPDAPALASHGERRAEPWGGITYLDVGRAGAKDLRSRLAEAQCDRIWLNSVWDREFTLPALALRRLGAPIPRQALLSTRGEFSSGALALRRTRKAAMRRALVFGGLLDDVVFHATNADEAGDVARAFPTGAIFTAGNLRALPQLPAHVERGDGPLRLLYLGRISPVKGLHNALAAMVHLTVPAVLTVCGPVHDQAYMEACSQLLRTIPGHVNVCFAGPVTNAQSSDRYAAADLFLNPSASENFGHTIFESLAAGTPVLTGLATPWKDLERDRAGFNIASDNPRGIAEAIHRFAALTPAKQLEWRAAARERAIRQSNDADTIRQWRDWLTGGLPAIRHVSRP